MEHFETTPHHTTGKIEWKGSTLLGALPSVMVSCGTRDAPNIITVAWSGIVNSKPPMTYVSIRPERYSHHLILENRSFVINLVPQKMVRACDYCGIYTGAKVSKFEKLHLTPTPSLSVDAPMILECPVSLSCQVKEVISLGSHDMFLAEIVGVSVSPELLDQNGKLNMEKADLITSMHGAYYSVGRRLGKLGFSTKPNQGKKRTSK